MPANIDSRSAIHTQRFVIPAGTSAQKLKALLKEQLEFEEQPAQTLTRTYFDSFDGRLDNSGTIVEKIASDNGLTLNLCDLQSGDTLANAAINNMPRFVWELAPSRLRQRLAPPLEMRALLPLACVHSKVQHLSVLNKEQKTIVRLVFEQNEASRSPRSKRYPLGASLCIEPVRGYLKPLHKIVNIIRNHLGLEPEPSSLPQQVLETLSIQTTTYTSKLNLQLEPEMRADEATRTILLRLLEIMHCNEDGLRKDLDSEFLHDFRVAVRRTRSALAQIKSVLPQRTLDRFRREFNWLGEITGPTRDMDVYLLKFDEYKSSLPSSVQNDLDPLHDFLYRHQRFEHEKLVKQLGSARYRKLVQDWKTYLNSPLPACTSLANAMRPVPAVANERIWRMYKRILKEGGAIDKNSPAEDLHELRKTGKKLRYLIEFFQNVYPPKTIKRLLKALKGLQEQLGDFQDLHVQITALDGFLKQMAEEGEVAEATKAAIERLINQLDQRQHQVRKDFDARFTHFAASDNKETFKALFKPKTETQVSAV